MPETRGDNRTEQAATRVTPSLKKAVEREAHREGKTISEWLRALITDELKRRGSMPSGFSPEDLEEG